jgi:hypothetical protein
MPFFRPVARLPGPAAVRPLPPVARRQLPPRLLRSVARPPSPESEPGLPVARPRCSSASHIGCPMNAVAPTPSVGCPTSVTGVRGPVRRSPGSVAPRRRPPITDRRCRPAAGGRLPDLRHRSEARSAGCPAPLPLDSPTGCPMTMPPRLRRPVARPPSPGARPGLPVARPRCLSASFTLTRFPVPSP